MSQKRFNVLLMIRLVFPCVEIVVFLVVIGAVFVNVQKVICNVDKNAQEYHQ